MSVFTKQYSKGSAVLLILRLVLGIIFFAHGAQKVLGWFGGYGLEATITGFEHGGIPPFLGYMVAFTEFLGGISLVLGLITRIFALGIFVDMIVAVLKVHLSLGFFMNWGAQGGRGEGFEYGLLLMAASLVVLILGPGDYSLDWMLFRGAREQHLQQSTSDVNLVKR